MFKNRNKRIKGYKFDTKYNIYITFHFNKIISPSFSVWYIYSFLEIFRVLTAQIFMYLLGKQNIFI